MKVYTIKEAARVTKIGGEALQRACEEGLIKASRLPNKQWRISESALEEALHEGVIFSSAPKRTGKKKPQPEALRKYHEEKRKAA
jgi:excisionase family DNA binding protein